MMGIRSATEAVEESARAVSDLADTVRVEVSGISEQLKTGKQYASYLLIGVAVICLASLVLSITALTRDA
jgi:hypothetical protein